MPGRLNVRTLEHMARVLNHAQSIVGEGNALLDIPQLKSELAFQ